MLKILKTENSLNLKMKMWKNSTSRRAIRIVIWVGICHVFTYNFKLWEYFNQQSKCYSRCLAYDKTWTVEIQYILQVPGEFGWSKFVIISSNVIHLVTDDVMISCIFIRFSRCTKMIIKVLKNQTYLWLNLCCTWFWFLYWHFRRLDKKIMATRPGQRTVTLQWLYKFHIIIYLFKI